MIQIRLGLPHRPGRVIEAELPQLGCLASHVVDASSTLVARSVSTTWWLLR
jgi:hypothetical protein